MRRSKLVNLWKEWQLLVILGLLGACLAAWAIIALELRKHTVFEDRVYVIATDHSPPFQVVNPDGTVNGAAAETVERAARRLGIKIRWKPVETGPDDVVGVDPEVDLWPFIMDLPERHSRFHIAEPYVSSTYMLISRTPLLRTSADALAGQKIAFRNIPHFHRLFRESFPQSEGAAIDNIDDILVAVCRGDVFAGVTEMNHVTRFFLQSRSGCPEGALHIRGIPEWKVNLSIASTFDTRTLADALRNEMGVLARERALDDLFTQYQPLAAMSSRDTFTPTSAERHLTLHMLELAALSLLTAYLGYRVMVLRNKNRYALRLADDRYRYLADMSHELRTPLNGILGMASLLEEAKLNEREQECLATIQTSGNELLALINNVLDLTKFEFSGQTPEPETVAARKLIESAVHIFGPALHQKNLETVIQFASGVPECLTLDKGKLRQILVNLVGNAVKYTEKGYVHIFVSLVRFPSGDTHLRVEVEDSGPGISAADQRKLFGNFQQTEAGLHSRESGSGLGLAIARRLASISGGSMGLDSELGRGSRFWFELPCWPVTPAATYADSRLQDDNDNDRPKPEHDLDEVRTVEPGIAVLVTKSATLAEALSGDLGELGWNCLWRERISEVLDKRGEALASSSLLAVDFNCLRGCTEMELDMLQRLCAAPSPAVVVLCNGNADFQGLATLGIIGVRHLYKPVSGKSLMRELGRREEARAADLRNLAIAVKHTSPSDRTKLSTGSASGLRVLVGEDNPVNQLVIRGILERLGHHPTVVEDGESVVQEFILDSHYDLVLLDCNMPRMDGFEAARTLRAMAAGSTIPIVAVTAHSPMEVQERCLKSGMNAVVGKPITKNTLKELTGLVVHS